MHNSLRMFVGSFYISEVVKLCLSFVAAMALNAFEKRISRYKRR